MIALITFTVLCTALYYGAARASITEPIWKRYPAFLDRLARCPACSGWWIGALLALYMSPVEGVAHFPSHPLIERALLGACFGMVLTPLGTYLVLTTLAYTTVPSDIEPSPPPPEEAPHG
jgi:hypothetical protein